MSQFRPVNTQIIRSAELNDLYRRRVSQRDLSSCPCRNFRISNRRQYPKYLSGHL